MHYGDTWHPLAIEVKNEVVGFLMWAVDDDESRWIGGLVIDAAHQRHGVARAAVTEAIRLLIAQQGCTGVALSYNATNQAARSLYAGLGFVETRRDRRRWCRAGQPPQPLGSPEAGGERNAGRLASSGARPAAAE